MAKGPKKQDYAPSAAEQASASVAAAEKKYFREKYDPLLRQRRDESRSDDFNKQLAGRANADWSQALTKDMDYNQFMRGGGGEQAGGMSTALSDQTGIARARALERKNQEQLGVLGTARGQASDAQRGLAAAADLGTSRGLSKAAAKQEENLAKYGMAGQLASATVLQGIKNMKSKGTIQRDSPEGPLNSEEVQGSFFQGVDKDGQPTGLSSWWG